MCVIDNTTFQLKYVFETFVFKIGREFFASYSSGTIEHHIFRLLFFKHINNYRNGFFVCIHIGQ